MSAQTVSKLINDVGSVCEKAHGGLVHGTGINDVQADEITSYVRTRKHTGGAAGYFHTWIAIDPKSKIILAWHTGRRTKKDGERFIADLKAATCDRVQITTDAYAAYQGSIQEVFGCKARHNVIRKGQFLKLQNCHTSFIETFNNRLRGLARFRRKSMAFSKTLRAHLDMLAIYFFYYNFGRVHSKHRVTPAMEAGIADHIWSLEEIITMNPSKCQPAQLRSAA